MELSDQTNLCSIFYLSLIDANGMDKIIGLSATCHDSIITKQSCIQTALTCIKW